MHKIRLDFIYGVVDKKRNDEILSYHLLVYKILHHYKIQYNFNPDFDDDYLNEGMLALTHAYNTYNKDSGIKFITYAFNCINNRYRDLFKKKNFKIEPLDKEIKEDLFLMDIIPAREDSILDKLIIKETKEELKKSLDNLNDEDKFIVTSLYGIGTKSTTQKKLAKQLNCTQSCIAKKRNKILNLIKEDLKY